MIALFGCVVVSLQAIEERLGATPWSLLCLSLPAVTLVFVGCSSPRAVPATPALVEVDEVGVEDWLQALDSDRPQARAWALSEIESHYEAARERGEDAERRLRDQLIEPFVEAYLRRFPTDAEQYDHEGRTWAEMNAEELRMLELLVQFRDPRALPAAVVAGGVYSESDLSGRVAIVAELVRSSGVPREERGSIRRFLLNQISNAGAHEGAIYRVLGAVPGAEAREILALRMMAGLLDDSKQCSTLWAMPALALRGEAESVDLFVRALFASWNPRICFWNEEPPPAPVVQLAMFGRNAFGPLLRLVRGQHESGEAAAARFVRARRRCAEENVFRTWSFPVSTSSREMASLEAVAALGELGDPRAVEVLAESLESHNASIRLMAAESLRRLEIPEVATPLLVRFAAAQRQAPLLEQERIVRLLAELGTEQAIASLLTTYRPSTEVVDKRAAVVWGQALQNYVGLASRAERDAIVGDPQVAPWLGALRQSDAWQLAERCDLSVRCHLAALNEDLLATSSGAGQWLTSEALRRHELVLRRVGRGDVRVFRGLLELSRSRYHYIRDFAFRTMIAVGAGDPHIFAVVESSRRHRFHDELLYRRLRIRQRLN